MVVVGVVVHGRGGDRGDRGGRGGRGGRCGYTLHEIPLSMAYKLP